MNNDFKNDQDFKDKEKVKKYVLKMSNIPFLTTERINLMIDIFNKYGDYPKEFLLLKIGEILIRFREFGRRE